MEMYVRSPSKTRNVLVKLGAVAAAGALAVGGWIYTGRYLEKRRIAESQEAAAYTEIGNYIAKDDYNKAWDKIKEFAAAHRLSQKDAEKFTDSKRRMIDARKIQRINERIEQYDYGAARKMLGEFRKELPEDRVSGIESEIEAINPEKILDNIDVIFKGSLHENPNIIRRENFYDALGKVHALSSRYLGAAERLVTYRLIVLDGELSGCNVDKNFVLEQISDLEKYHAGIHNQVFEAEFVESAMSYIRNNMGYEKPGIVDAIVEKTPVIFGMPEDKKKKFQKDAIVAYAKFYSRMCTKHAKPEYMNEMMNYLLSSALKYGIDMNELNREMKDTFKIK